MREIVEIATKNEVKYGTIEKIIKEALEQHKINAEIVTLRVFDTENMLTRTPTNEIYSMKFTLEGSPVSGKTYGEILDAALRNKNSIEYRTLTWVAFKYTGMDSICKQICVKICNTYGFYLDRNERGDFNV